MFPIMCLVDHRTVCETHILVLALDEFRVESFVTFETNNLIIIHRDWPGAWRCAQQQGETVFAPCPRWWCAETVCPPPLKCSVSNFLDHVADTSYLSPYHYM